MSLGRQITYVFMGEVEKGPKINSVQGEIDRGGGDRSLFSITLQ